MTKVADSKNRSHDMQIGVWYSPRIKGDAEEKDEEILMEKVVRLHFSDFTFICASLLTPLQKCDTVLHWWYLRTRPARENIYVLPLLLYPSHFWCWKKKNCINARRRSWIYHRSLSGSSRWVCMVSNLQSEFLFFLLFLRLLPRKSFALLFDLVWDQS